MRLETRKICVSHRDGGFAERHIQHHIGGLAAHARQLFQRIAGGGHLAGMLFEQQFRQRDDILRLAAIQPDGFDHLGQFWPRPAPPFSADVSMVLNKGSVALLTRFVGGLGRQRHCDQQGIRIFIFKFGLGFGIDFFQTREEFFYLRARHQFGHYRPKTSVIP